MATRKRVSRKQASGYGSENGAAETRGLGVLVERMGSDLRMVAEAVQGLGESVNRQLGEVHARFDQVDRRFDQVDQRFEQVDQRFERIDQRFERIDQRFEQTDRELALVKSAVLETHREVKELRHAVEDLDARKVDRKELVWLR